MDVNGTPLHLVLGLDDWEHALAGPVDPDVCFDPRRHTIGLRPRPFVFPTRSDAVRLMADDRRGAAVDRFGNVFWIGADRRSIRATGADGHHAFVWHAPSDDSPDHTPTLTPADPSSTFVACSPAVTEHPELVGMTISENQYLVVGVRGLEADDGARGAGLLVFDLAGGGPPVALRWMVGIGVRPIDLAALPDGGIVVLDVPDVGPPRLWQLDRNFRVTRLGAAADVATATSSTSPFEPVGPTPPVTVVDTTHDVAELHRAGVEFAAVLDTGDPVSVDALPDGTVLVLSSSGGDGRPDVSRWACGEHIPFGLRYGDDDDEEAGFVCSDQRSNARDVLAGALAHDFVVVDPEPGSTAIARLFLVDDRGDQAFEFAIDADGAELVPSYHPLRLFSGKALVGHGATALYDLDQRWFPIASRPVDRFAGDAVITLAPESATGRGFDAGTPATVWHRLVLDGAIPAGCSIEIESRAADDLAVIDRQPWRAEPQPYLRGRDSEIPYHRYPDSAPCAGQGSWELLFQGAVGRFLQLRMTMRGDGRRTPRVWSVRIHAPRFSYLEQYLPAIYREDRESASFLDRYLANVEGLYTTLEGSITDAQRLVDPTTIDAEYLPWLASWVGATVESDWDDGRRRLFVRHAARLFARRGTTRGMIDAIRLATHPCPTDDLFDPEGSIGSFDVRIVEAFRTRSVPGVVFGDPNDLEGPRLDPASPRWTLADGGADLHARWREFLESRHGSPVEPALFPVLTPPATIAADDWHDFVRGELSMTYADVGSSDLAAYRSFLEQRYRRFAAYASTWNVAVGGAFAAVTLPTTLPSDGAPLQDWIMFVSAVLPARRAAHRATVLVPIRLDDSDEVREQRLGRVRSVVDVDRPAHVVVDVQPYWAAMRVGEARVGFETIVGEGGRFVDLVLGRDRLGTSVIPGGRTWRLENRMVVGRDRIERSVEPAGTGGF